MKNLIKTSALLIAITFSHIVLASGDKEREKNIKLLSNTIKPVITKALVQAELSHIDTHNKIVLVYAKISPNLTLEVADVRSENPVLSKYVLQQLNHLELENITEDFDGAFIKIPLEFKD